MSNLKKNLKPTKSHHINTRKTSRHHGSFQNEIPENESEMMTKAMINKIRGAPHQKKKNPLTYFDRQFFIVWMEIPEELGSAHQSSTKNEPVIKNGNQVDSMAGRISERDHTDMGHTSPATL